MQVDESALTGESVPVSKTAEVLDEETNIADRQNILFRGTALTRGSGEGVVVGHGNEHRTRAHFRTHRLGRRRNYPP